MLGSYAIGQTYLGQTSPASTAPGPPGVHPDITQAKATTGESRSTVTSGDGRTLFGDA